MKNLSVLFSAMLISALPLLARAQETTTGTVGAAAAPDPEIDACRASGLIALKERSSAVKDLSLDLDSMRVIKVNSKIEDVPVRAIVLGDAYIEKKKSDKAQTFVCVVGDKGKVLLTIFSEQ